MSEDRRRWRRLGHELRLTLQIADQKTAYTITDRATYLALQKNLALQVLNEGDKAYFNVYHVVTLNPEKNPKINVDGGNAFAQFMISKEAQEIIRTFGVDKYGQALFVPDVGKTAEQLGVK